MHCFYSEKQQMSEYRPPALPESIAVEYFSLSLRGDVEISTQHLSRIREASGQTVEEPHLSFQTVLSGPGYTAGVFGLIGVHTTSRRDEKAEQQQLSSVDGEPLASTFEVHYEFVVRPQVKPSAKSNPHWDALRRSLEGTIPLHSAQVDLLLVADEIEFGFPVSVPLPLNPTDVPGFSEIRGLRLVQLDPENPDVELYYAILDRSGGRRSVQISSPVEVEWTDDILHSAMNHALSIVEIATRPSDKEVL